MRKLIFIADAETYDRNHCKYDKYITFANVTEDVKFSEEGYYSHKDFAEYINELKPKRIAFSFDTQDEFDFIIDLISGFVTSLDILAEHNKKYNFSALEKCSELEAIQFYWNTKQDTLWDIKKNEKLKSFEIMDYYQVSDFSVFSGSTIESLYLFGCNRLSSFTPKMHVKDFSFIKDMPFLKELHIDIIKDEPSEYYLSLLAECVNLKILVTPANFFTFQQFAWLRSKLPQVTEGLDCVYEYGDKFYGIIGNKMPGMLDDVAKTQKYQIRYDALVNKYKTRKDPPTDQEKD